MALRIAPLLIHSEIVCIGRYRRLGCGIPDTVKFDVAHEAHLQPTNYVKFIDIITSCKKIKRLN